MGLVYLCEHLKMKRPVAVKVLPHRTRPSRGSSTAFSARPRRRRSKHPNIVQAYDIDQDNGVHYLVMGS